MIKVGNRVSLFHNIGKEGNVIGLQPIRVNTSFTGGSATNSWRIHIKWDDGTESFENVADVMRID